MLKAKWRLDPALSGSPGIVHSQQIYRHRLAMKRGRPFAGAYYWVPNGDRCWSILVFPNAFYEGGEAGHVDVWNEVVLILSNWHKLNQIETRRKIGNCPYGLPRGRVVRMGNGQWGVAHGNDHPCEVPFWDVVKEAFCLRDVSPRFFFDSHEQMLDHDQTIVTSALGIAGDYSDPSWLVSHRDCPAFRSD